MDEHHFTLQEPAVSGSEGRVADCAAANWRIDQKHDGRTFARSGDRDQELPGSSPISQHIRIQRGRDSMSLIRAPRPESNFYILDKAISQDKRLSWGARGLLIYLLGKPDNWAVSVEDLRNQTKDTDKPAGRDAVYSLIGELIRAGYVRRTQTRIEQGGFSRNDYEVRECPLPENPYTAEPDTANPTLTSTDTKQEKKDTKRDQQADAIPYEQIFDTYETVLPGKPRLKIRDDARRKSVRSIWNKDKRFQSLEFWQRYFAVVRKSDFLMGQSTFAFDWLVKPANFKKVVEGNYDNA